MGFVRIVCKIEDYVIERYRQGASVPGGFLFDDGFFAEVGTGAGPLDGSIGRQMEEGFDKAASKMFFTGDGMTNDHPKQLPTYPPPEPPKTFEVPDDEKDLRVCDIWAREPMLYGLGHGDDKSLYWSGERLRRNVEEAQDKHKRWLETYGHIEVFEV